MTATFKTSGGGSARARFTVAAVALVLLIVGHPLLTGRVYSQADILFGEYPWAAQRPSGFDAPANSLLGDVPMLMYPGLAFARDRVTSGRLPTWNPHLFGGQPFIGATQTAVFSPFTAIAYVVPLPDALTWIYMARLMLGGFGMFVFLGALGLAPPARLFGGLAWMLTPFTIVWLAHPLSEIAAWMPWMVLATLNTMRRGRGRDVAALAAVTALSLAAGHPETTLKSLLFCGALALVLARAPRMRADEDRPGGAVRALARALAAVVLGVLLAGIQVVPSLEYLAESEALAGRERSGPNVYVVPPETLVTAIVPNFLGHPATRTYLPMENRYGLASNYAEQQAYAGVAVWLLAAVGAWQRRRAALERGLVGICVLAAAIMYGAPGLDTLVAHTPGLAIVVLSRFGIVIAFGAVWLAAVGLDALLTSRARIAVWPAGVAALAGTSLVLASLVFFREALTSHARLATTLGWTAFAGVLAVVTLMAVSWRARERLSPRRFATIVTAALVVDLAVFAHGFHVPIDRALVFPDVPAIAAVAADRGLYRVGGWRHALLPNAATVYGLSDYRGYDGIAPYRWGVMLDVALPRDQAQFREFRDLSALRLLRLLNVRYIFADPDAPLERAGLTRLTTTGAPVWRDDRAFPRAFLANRFHVVRTPDALLEALRDPAVDLRTTVLLDTSPDGSVSTEAGAWPAATTDAADVRHYRDDFVEIHARVQAPKILVLSDNHFPGWTVTVDGRPSPMLRVDGALRGVFLEAGTHVVRFAYAPASVRLGLGLSALGALIVAALLVHDARRKPA